MHSCSSLDCWLTISYWIGEPNEDKFNGMPNLVFVHVPPCAPLTNDMRGLDVVGGEIQASLETKCETSTPMY